MAPSSSMTGVLRTLSVSYVRRHAGLTLLAVTGVAIGVAAFVAVRAAQDALASGLRQTVALVAGRADLQITAPGGIPEDRREVLRQVAAVDADAPVIEQIVLPRPARLGSLLVIGVDLVGDASVRPYAFAGDDADVDDPLEFLAQPDSIAVTRVFADRAGLGKGDNLDVSIGGLAHRLTIRALLDGSGFAAAYGGNVAVVDVYAAEDLFGRGRRFDRIDVRLRPGNDLAQATEAVRRALGTGYGVDVPEARGASLEATAKSVIDGFDVLTLIAVSLGLFVISCVCAVSVERRRRDIGILRACGATPRQVLTIFLVEAAVLGAAGGVAGVVLGTLAGARLHDLLNAALELVKGMREEQASRLTGSLIAQGIGLGVAGALAGAWRPARRAAGIAPIVATATGSFAASAEPLSPWAAPAGAALLALAWWASRSPLVPAREVLPLVALIGALGAMALSGHGARAIVRLVVRPLAWIAPASGRIATDALLAHPRRTATGASVLVLTGAFALGLAGFVGGVRARAERWAADAVVSDIVVRASPGLGASNVHLPPELPDHVRTVPGVASVDPLRTVLVDYDGRPATISAFDSKGLVASAPRAVLAGDAGLLPRLADRLGECVVTDIFARRFGVSVGDIVTLNSPTGTLALTAGEIVGGARAMVMIDRRLYAARWQDDRPDTLYVALTPGADAAAVREAIRARAGNGPVLVSTREEIVAAWRRSLSVLDAVIAGIIVLGAGIAVAGSAATLALSATDRARETGILRAIGAAPAQIAVSNVVEAGALTFASLVLAVPLGDALAWLLRTHVARVTNSVLPPVHSAAVLGLVAAGLAAAALVAIWMPVRWARTLRIVEAIAYE